MRGTPLTSELRSSSSPVHKRNKLFKWVKRELSSTKVVLDRLSKLLNPLRVRTSQHTHTPKQIFLPLWPQWSLESRCSWRLDIYHSKYLFGSCLRRDLASPVWIRLYRARGPYFIMYLLKSLWSRNVSVLRNAAQMNKYGVLCMKFRFSFLKCYYHALKMLKMRHIFKRFRC